MCNGRSAAAAKTSPWQRASARSRASKRLQIAFKTMVLASTPAVAAKVTLEKVIQAARDGVRNLKVLTNVAVPRPIIHVQRARTWKS